MPNLILSCAIEMLKYIYLNINLAIFFNFYVSCHVHCIK